VNELLLPACLEDPCFVLVGAERRHLTPLEWTVLMVLWRHRDRLSSHQVLGDALVDRSQRVLVDTQNLLKVVICRLRVKLAGTPLQINTVHSQGYRLHHLLAEQAAAA
jgi:DNA-binding response OmpR family regulator